MVNKPHPSRSSRGGKKPAVAGLDGEDTSFIIFGNEKSSKKPRTTLQANDGANTASSKGKAASNTAATTSEAEKKPDTRTLIAGASWTGKLPMTLFNELCQKQKWERPEYLVRGNATSGYTCSVLLRRKHPKTQEITQLPIISLPRAYPDEKASQPSSIEAKHYGAAYALFRVRNATSLYTTLPPQYRDLWKEDWTELKKEAVEQGQGYLYDADPFAAFKQHEDSKAAKEKARVDRQKQKAVEEKSQVIGMDGRVQDKYALKGWQKTPRVEMGSKSRVRIEKLVRSAQVWNPHELRLNTQEQTAIVRSLAQSGFRQSHIEEAAELCKDKEECLEWLLIHVPEDDLPGWALPENYVAGISLAGDIKRERAIERLAAAGYSKDLCVEVFDDCKGDEAAAAAALQQRLIELSIVVGGASEDNVWDEELEALGAIFGDRYTNHSRTCTIRLDVQTAKKRPIHLRAQPPQQQYPQNLPILAIEAELPAYIRLSITKKCLEYADACLRGDQMLFNITDWLEMEIPAIMLNPGRLSDVANAVVPPPAGVNQTARRSKARPHPRPIVWSANSGVSQKLLAEHEQKRSRPAQQKMLQSRQTLPAWKLKDDIVRAVSQNQVTIISGETGSGKSTQSVQFILDDLIDRGLGEHVNIICTQPRRISALGLADRVADERCSTVGDEIGYAIRGEAKQKAGVTKICFVTTGVLLRRLQTSGGSAEDIVKSIANVSHIVIDEVHERSLDTDFLLILIRDVLKKRKDLKLVLMSATLDSATFERYFRGTSTVGRVEIAGRTHPVSDIYLEEIALAAGFGDLGLNGPANSFEEADQQGTSAGRILKAVGMRINYDLIAETVRGIDSELGSQDGGILIFLPGVAEIDQTLRALRNEAGLHVLPLHASLQSSEQRRVFQRAPPGKRKVVAATNVAETSITIDDIVAVIDTGKVKETSYDPANNMVRLAEVWASRAACKQRRGRAGRVRAGKCYKLYTREAEEKMNERPDPEIMRVPLQQLCLSVRAMGIADVESFLASTLTPPNVTAVEGAMTLLRRIGALDGQQLTSLGRHLSLIPADLRCAKLLVYGAAFGCLDACLTIAAILTVKSPFVSPRDRREESRAARLGFGSSNGDLIVDLNAFNAWSQRRSEGLSTAALRRWCDENFLNQQTLFDIKTNRTQFLSSLKEIGFLPTGYSLDQDAKSGESQDNLLRALIAGAFQPQIARIDLPDKKYAASSSGAIEVDPEARTIKYYDEDNGRVFVHPSSILFGAQSFSGDARYMSYFTKMATSKIFIRDLTPFNVYSLLMFSGPITIDAQGRGLLVDGWLRVRGWARIGVLTSRLRMMLDDLLGKKLDDPSLDLTQSPVVDCVRKLIELDGMDV